MRFLIILEVQHLESRKLQALESSGHRLREPTICGLAIAIATVLCETSSSKVHEVRLAPLERYAATPEIISQSAVLFVLDLAISIAIVLCECPSCETHLFFSRRICRRQASRRSCPCRRSWSDSLFRVRCFSKAVSEHEGGKYAVGVVSLEVRISNGKSRASSQVISRAAERLIARFQPACQLLKLDFATAHCKW